MAENTTTRVVEVQVDNAEAIKLIADYNAKIEESTAKEKALREAIKKKGEATAADREELAKLRAEQTAYKRELREVEKEVQNNIKAAREEEGSNRKLRAELSNLTKQYDSMSAAMQKSAEGEALKKQINEITDALLESEEGTQRFYRNVGNYPDIKPLETQLGVIRQQLAQMKYEGKETTQEYQDLLGVAANMKDALADVEAGINAGASDTAQLDVLIKGTQNLLQLWAQWSILSKQLGVENKDLDKAIGIITQTLGALVAIQSVQNMLQKQSIVMQKSTSGCNMGTDESGNRPDVGDGRRDGCHKRRNRRSMEIHGGAFLQTQSGLSSRQLSRQSRPFMPSSRRLVGSIRRPKKRKRI
ncbi:MAG: hypothetical protein ACLRR1_11100 [Alistipes shahii]|uniref:hypothetical protein n=1 Tax=Alistipes shahii TaxID=328814 RepID=UPI00399078D3